MTDPTPTPPGAPALYEQCAAIEHARWADWQRWMHAQGTRNPDGSLTLPAALVERWERQIATPYAALSEREQQSDREQVDRYWPLVHAALARQAPLVTAARAYVDVLHGAGVRERVSRWEALKAAVRGLEETDGA